MTKWNVYLNGQRVNCVFFIDTCDADFVRRSLINHDGYNVAIVVRRVLRGVA